MTTSLSVKIKEFESNFKNIVGKKKTSYNPEAFMKSNMKVVQEKTLKKVAKYLATNNKVSLMLMVQKFANWMNMYSFNNVPTEENMVVYENLNRFLYMLPLDYVATFCALCNGCYYQNEQENISFQEKKGYKIRKTINTVYSFEMNNHWPLCKREGCDYKPGSFSYILKRVKNEILLKD